MASRQGLVRVVALWTVVVVGLAAVVSLGRQGLVDLVTLTGQRDALKLEVAALHQRNQRMMALIKRLKEEPQAIEEAARADLGLARPNEIVYLFKSAGGGPGGADGQSGAGPQN